MNVSQSTPSFSLDLRPSDQTAAPDHASLSLDEFLAACRRHVGKLTLWCCICLAAAVVYLVETPSQYVASTLMLLDPVRPTVSAVSGDSGRLVVSLDAAQAESHIQVVKSERILRFVFDTLDLWHSPDFAEEPPGWRERVLARFVPRPPPTEDESRAAAFLAFMSRVGARRIGQSYVLELSYTALDAATATRTVNAITSAYLWDQVSSAGRGSEFLQTRIADLKAEADAALQGIRQGRIPDMRFPDADARVISAAIKPTARSYPQSKVVLAFALAFALVTGLGTILMAHTLDRRIRTRRQIVRHLGLPCLAELPILSARARRLRPPRGSVLAGADDALLQALRATRGVLISARVDRRHRSIGLVSWRRGEGTTTIASGLAQITAAASEPVVLVDANLQDPSLTLCLGPEEDFGLTDSLLARDPPEALPIVQVSSHLTFVPAVGCAAGKNPHAFVGLPEMQLYLDRLRQDGGVIVDLPALQSSADAQVLGQMLDGVIVVVEAARTTLDEAHDCLTALRNAKIDVLGVILNKASRPPSGRA